MFSQACVKNSVHRGRRALRSCLTIFLSFFTARKRSLGQGNIFTPVCHSVHRGGVRGCSGGHAWLLRGACMVAPGGCAWLLGGACMVAPGGVHGCSGGACVVAQGGHAWLLQGGMRGCSGGACMVALGGHAWLLRGACMVLFGGHAWFYSGGMRGFIWGVCVVFSVFSDTMRYGQWAAVRILLECILVWNWSFATLCTIGTWRAIFYHKQARTRALSVCESLVSTLQKTQDKISSRIKNGIMFWLACSRLHIIFSRMHTAFYWYLKASAE